MANLQDREPRNAFAMIALVFALSVPIWIAGGMSGLELLPKLPVAAVSVVLPVLAAAILTYRNAGMAGVSALLRRAFDMGRINRPLWLVPLIAIVPAVDVASFYILRARGAAIPDPHFTGGEVLSLSVLFLIGAICEELGWSGYATEPLQARFGALGGALVLGVVWAGWHLVPLLEVDRTAAWIAWWSLGTVTMRVIIVWLYNNCGRSVFASALFHALSNLGWQLFPVHGSYFDPRIHGLLMTGVAAAIVIGSEPRTLTRP